MGRKQNTERGERSVFYIPAANLSGVYATSQAIRRLAAGDSLQVIARGKVWSKVMDPLTGKTGYVANDYTTLF